MIDLDSAKIIKAETKIEDVPIRTVVIGDAYIERTKTSKPQTLVCIIGDKGKVLLTLFLIARESGSRHTRAGKEVGVARFVSCGAG